jgi:hypothetical protein
VVGVVQAQATTSLFKLMRSQAFEGSLSCDRHEYGQWNGAMGQLEGSSTCLGDLDGGSVFTLYSTSTATYRAPGDWLVRQGRVHLARYSCCRLLEGRDGD